MLFPLLILLCRKHLVWVLLALVAVQLFMVRTPLLMVVRTDALALGVLLAMWSAQPGYQRWQPTFLRRPWTGFSVLIAVGLLMSFLATDFFPRLTIESAPLPYSALYWCGSPLTTVTIYCLRDICSG